MSDLFVHIWQRVIFGKIFDGEEDDEEEPADTQRYLITSSRYRSCSFCKNANSVSRCFYVYVFRTSAHGIWRSWDYRFVPVTLLVWDAARADLFMITSLSDLIRHISVLFMTVIFVSGLIYFFPQRHCYLVGRLRQMSVLLVDFPLNLGHEPCIYTHVLGRIGAFPKYSFINLHCNKFYSENKLKLQ